MGIRVKSKQNKDNDFQQTRATATIRKFSETVYISRIYIHTIWKKHQGIEN